MQEFIQDIAYAFEAGGYMMVVIAFVLTFTVVVIIERYYTLFRKYDLDANSLMSEIRKYVLAGDVDGAIRVCNGAERSALARVLKAGLSRASRTEGQVQNAIDSISLEVIGKIEKRIAYLSMLANVATLFGLLGTIIGLMHAFSAIALADPSQKSAILSKGIAEAMNCTAFGLMTAIVAMISHSWLSSKATKIVSDVDEYSVKLMDLLSAQKLKNSGEN